MDALSLAIFICDASFEYNNFNRHINQTNHLKEMGLTPEEYYKQSEQLTLASGPNILKFKRKDGMDVKFNFKTRNFVVYDPKTDRVKTFYKIRYSQVKNDLVEEGYNVPEKLERLVQIQLARGK